MSTSRAGHGAAGVGEHVEVLLGGVEHGETRSLEQRHELVHIGGEWIDQRDLIAPRQLHQGQLRVVRPLPVELGVEGVARLGQDLLDDLLQLAAVGDPASRLVCFALRHAVGSPATSSSPLSTQAMTPPATFTAGIPFSMRNSLAM